MALTSYPFENANTTEDQYTLLFRNFVDSGIIGSYGDDQFVVSSDGSGLDVQVSAGYAILRGHAVSNDGPVTLTLDAADASFARIDRIVLRLDPVLNGINLAVIKGTPASTPVAPPIVRTDTGVWDLPLATVKVGANALNVLATDIVGTRSWGSHRFGVWSTAGRPETARIGQPGFNVDNSGVEIWTGTKWEPFVAKKRIVVPHTFTLAGPVVLAQSSGDYYIPPFFVPQVAGQTVRMVGARSIIKHGDGTAQVGFQLHSSSIVKAGPATETKVHFSGTATKLTVAHSFTSDLTGWDDIQLTVTGVVADPKNLSLTVFLEYEA